MGQKKPTIKTTLINTQSLSKQSINRFSFPVVQWSARPDRIKFQSINRRIPEFQTVIANLPVSIKGCVVKRGVSSAVHAIHIGASPDTEKQKGLSVFHNTGNTQQEYHTLHQTNVAHPSVKSIHGCDCCYSDCHLTAPVSHGYIYFKVVAKLHVLSYSL